MSIDAMKQALEVLEEAVFYTSSESWSPSMTRECETAITALRAAIEQAQDPETELETYKRLYELRGKALERPCSNCGHQPAKIKAMAQPEHEPVTHTLNCVCGAVWDVSPHGVEEMVHAPTPHPRQWQGLTEAEKVNVAIDCGCADVAWMDFADAIEAKLKEKNNA